MDMTDRQPESGAVNVYEPGSAQEAPKATPRERGAASPFNFVKNLKIGRKLLLISAAFAVPLTVFATIYFVSLQAEVNRALLADHGALFLRETGDLVQAVPQHRGITNTLRNGNASVAERREALQLRVEEDLARVLAFEAQYEEELQPRRRTGRAQRGLVGNRRKPLYASRRSGVQYAHRLMQERLFPLLARPRTTRRCEPTTT